MTERPHAPREGELIKDAFDASGLSQREAARRAGISEGWWRQIVAGIQPRSGKPARGSDRTLARMARAVAVTPEQLEAAGRAGAAAALRDIEAKAVEAERRAAEFESVEGSQTRVEERWHMLEPVLRQAPVGLSPVEHDALRGLIAVFFEQSPEWRPPDDAPALEARRSRRMT